MVLTRARPSRCLFDSCGLSNKWLVVSLLLEEKLAKYHVEDREDYNREKMRYLYIDCRSLLHQYLSVSL